MIMHRIWFSRTYRKGLRGREEARRVEREGWFLLGIIPLYIRTRNLTEFK